MTVIEYLQATPAAFLTVAVILALLIGSFLNVVIHRLPLMLERDWRGQCRELLGDEAPPTTEAEPEERFNIIVPRSRCPHCGHGVTALENIPILSYVFLRGKCSACGARISLQYPLVEATSGLLGFAVAWHLGFTWATLAALGFTWALLALTVIDLREMYLPDIITLPLLWAGVLLNLDGTFTDIQSSVLGAVFGYLSLWSVYWGFKLLTGKEGMGAGDFKLLAAMGAWLGWQALPLIVLLSAVVGALVGIALIAFRNKGWETQIPYGPYLAAAGWIALLWGDTLTRVYLDYARIS